VPVQNVSNYFPWERSPGIDEVFRSFGWEPTEEVLFAQDFCRTAALRFPA